MSTALRDVKAREALGEIAKMSGLLQDLAYYLHGYLDGEVEWEDAKVKILEAFHASTGFTKFLFKLYGYFC